jgi:hypothetical protein
LTISVAASEPDPSKRSIAPHSSSLEGKGVPTNYVEKQLTFGAWLSKQYLAAQLDYWTRDPAALLASVCEEYEGLDSQQQCHE